MWFKSQLIMKNPILYSFRRWPYAIRARFALTFSNFTFEHREVNLKNRPKELYIISAKGTVPVLQLDNQTIIDESYDIMIWSNKNNNCFDLLSFNSELQKDLIKKNDSYFKYWLDRYKYYDRFPNESKEFYFEKASSFLLDINNMVKKNKYIMNDKIQLVDLAIFPFIRQFANVNINVFFDKFNHLKKWYLDLSDSDRFQSIMQKYDFWNKNNKPVLVNLNINKD